MAARDSLKTYRAKRRFGGRRRNHLRFLKSATRRGARARVDNLAIEPIDCRSRAAHVLTIRLRTMSRSFAV